MLSWTHKTVFYCVYFWYCFNISLYFADKQNNIKAIQVHVILMEIFSIENDNMKKNDVKHNPFQLEVMFLCENPCGGFFTGDNLLIIVYIIFSWLWGEQPTRIWINNAVIQLIRQVFFSSFIHSQYDIKLCGSKSLYSLFVDMQNDNNVVYEQNISNIK